MKTATFDGTPVLQMPRRRKTVDIVMTPTHQLALPLVDPLEPRILPQGGDAWFTLNRINADGRMAQRFYRLELIETVLRAVGRSLDTYMSQGFFAVPCRRAVHLAYMTHGYVDLDTDPSGTAFRPMKWCEKSSGSATTRASPSRP